MTKTDIQESGKITLAQICALCCFGFLLFAKAIGLNDDQKLYVLLLLGSGILFLAKLAMTRMTVLTCIASAALFLLCALTAHNSGDRGLLLYAFMMLVVKDVPMKRIFKVALWIWAPCFVIVTFLANYGLIGEVVAAHPKKGLGYVFCHALGYTHMNVLHVSYVVLMMLVLYLYEKRKTLGVCALLVLGSILIFTASMSFTGFGLSLLYVFFHLYLRSRRRLSAIERALALLIQPLCLAFAVVMPLALDGRGRVFDFFDALLNTRPYMSYWYMTEQKWTLFGSRIVVDDYHYTIDCSYVYLLMRFGIIAFVVFSLLFFLAIRDALKGGRRAELAILLGNTVAGVSEPYLFNPAFKNLGFLFLGAYRSRRKDAAPAKLGGSWNREFCVLAFGERELPASFEDGLSALEARLSVAWKTLTKRRLPVILAAGAVLGMLLFALLQKPVHTIYIDSRIYRNDDLVVQYLTPEEVQSEKAAGNLFYFYEDEQTPLHAYEGGPAVYEYGRRILYAGIYGAIAAAVLVYLKVLVQRKKIRRCDASDLGMPGDI